MKKEKKQLSIRAEVETLERLEKEAVKQGRSLPNLIAWILKNWKKGE